ncbi:jg21040 [Pararge aegeria aegeria]|uniref:Nuclear pore protein n=1 Tax=Pararge aegeria aegeria TaxID=348720 RepID=A0A8S4RQG2_9NEOP|nr:jg21040 [Pararge aegeria aegeria]
MADEDFSKLLQQAEQLTTEIEGNEELPRVERSLGQVLEASHELYSRVIQSGPNNIQAHVLFGSKGIDLQQISQKLETLSSKRTFEPLQPIADSDIESFLKNERENAILSLIDEVNKNSLQTTEDQKWEHMLSEWNKEKIKLMNAMIGPSQNWLDLKRTPELPSIADTPKKFGHSMLDSIEAAYARQVQQYNKLISHGAKSRTALHQKFSQVAEEFNDPKVKEMWEIIKTMANIPALVRDEDPLKARGNPTIQQCLIAQGKKYLEKRYKQYMSDVVRANPAAALRGGEPGTFPLVRGFVGLRLQGLNIQGLTDGVVDDRPLWPMVYYCLRSGDSNAALYCLRKAGRDHEEFIAALEDHIRDPEKALSDKLQTEINLKYRLQIRHSTDPYKRAVYCVVGCCDVSDEHSEVARTADDYLWLKLSAIKTLSVDTDDPVPLRRLNLARLILLYVRKFELSDPSDALNYYFFLRNLKDPSGKNLFMCCCTDLALESRDYDLLFGRMEASTGLRTSGLLDQFNNPHIDSKVIALNAAEQLVNKGLFEDAIIVYDIAGQLEWLREQAEVLNTFAGNIAYRMPGDTYSQLAQMQILMN